VPAVEVLIPNPAIRSLIREDKVHQIYSHMQMGQTASGMQTMNQALANLVLRRQIAPEEALGRSSDTAELQQLLENVARPSPPRG
jgi:twitching motility protein PilT